MRRLVISLLCLVLLCSVLLLPIGAQQLALPNQPNSVDFAAIGDMGTGDAAQYEIARQMSVYHHSSPFDFVIMLGDNIYGGHEAGDFEQKFSVPYKPLLDAGVKFYASLGNHDNSTVERFYKPFNMNGERYYSFKKGNVRFFALDSNYVDPGQLQWLENEFQKSAANDWKICYFHHPLYSSGKTHGSSMELRAVLEPLFIKYGVNVVFSGHDHVYERVKPQHGIYYFTEGAAGELRKGDLKKTDMTEKGFDQDRSFLLVEITGGEMDFQAIGRTGIKIDSGLIRKTATLPTASPLPAVP